jgi:hypothetical protein
VTSLRRRTESDERFLRGIAERLPAERVVEVHLFQPYRQGPLESGVAVIALEAGPEESGASTTDRGDRSRLVVYTATYRHTRKGPDRGAWSMEVVALADAPLEAIGSVVHGVQRRTADAGLADADRLSGEEFRALASVTGSEVGVGAVPAPGTK